MNTDLPTSPLQRHIRCIECNHFLHSLIVECHHGQSCRMLAQLCPRCRRAFRRPRAGLSFVRQLSTVLGDDERVLPLMKYLESGNAENGSERSKQNSDVSRCNKSHSRLLQMATQIRRSLGNIADVQQLIASTSGEMKASGAPIGVQVVLAGSGSRGIGRSAAAIARRR